MVMEGAQRRELVIVTQATLEAHVKTSARTFAVGRASAQREGACAWQGSLVQIARSLLVVAVTEIAPCLGGASVIQAG